MRFGTWNVRSHYRSDSLTAAARELARYKLDLLGVQEVRWDKGGTARGGEYNFFYVNKRKSSTGNGIFCTPQNTITS
jgi:exonuclease III